VCCITYGAGESILRIDGGPKVDARGTDEHDHDRKQHGRRTDQHFTHPHIVAYRAAVEDGAAREWYPRTVVVCLLPALNTSLHAIVK